MLRGLQHIFNLNLSDIFSEFFINRYCFPITITRANVSIARVCKFDDSTLTRCVITD